MKVKSLILLSVFLLYPVSVFAQWGVKGGVDFSTIFSSATLSSEKYQTGFNIGAISEPYMILNYQKNVFSTGFIVCY